MTIPTASNYPDVFDTETNLYVVHDSARVQLAEDYHPGDTSITVNDPQGIMFTLFPATGLITLTEQCNDPPLRALSFFYNGRTATQFTGLEILPGFIDVVKPKHVTDVTQNVMSDHHNNIKNAVIAIEKFIGVKGTLDIRPFGPTMEGRINFLRKLVLSPKAWFTVNKRIGLAPLTVVFTNQSFRLGDGCIKDTVKFVWDFGDETASIISCVIPSNASVVEIDNMLAGATISKIYTCPGVYDVSLTVTNSFGTDQVVFPELINVRIGAPDVAVVDFFPRSGQTVTPGVPVGGPYTTTPSIRSPANTLIDMGVNSGINSNTGRTYAGELVDGNSIPIDPITQYTWSLGDDLTHGSAPATRASFSIGGVYDLVLRTDTRFGAYRITKYANAFDIVENTNLWMWTYLPGGNNQFAQANEFGLISETFKTKSGTSWNIDTDTRFLKNLAPNPSVLAQMQQEYLRNVGFTQRGVSSSGQQGTALIYWASGRSDVAGPGEEQVNIAEYNGFSDTYTTRNSGFRPWNWVSLNSPSKVYFILGNVLAQPLAPNTSPANQQVLTLDMATMTFGQHNLIPSNYHNGAVELQNNIATYNGGTLASGYFATYRSAWKGTNGYFLRNDGVGSFFRIKTFYRTEPVGTIEFQNIRKLPDMTGPAKVEGQLVPLNSGLFFFNNSGAVSVYNDITGLWQTGGPGLNSASFRGLQDISKTNYDSQANTLIAASDGDSRAYLSFDYSPNAFIKFDVNTLTFSSMGARPNAKQWQMGIF
jgi:PKD repeat protein